MTIQIKDLRTPEEKLELVRICFLLPKKTTEKLEEIQEDYRNSYHKEVTRTSIIKTMINDYIHRVEEDPTLIKEGVF